MTGDPMCATRRETGNRLLVDYSAGKAGPCLVVVAALHGDEKGGLIALERVAGALEANRPPMRGKILGVLGNLAALDADTRYIDRDLNRGWSEENVERLRLRDPSTDSAEDREARELVVLLDELENETCRPVVFADLHSTSADGAPFICMPDTLTNLKMALELPFPSILGLEETIDGPLAGLVSDRGYRSIIVEGGRHDRARTADVLESCVWVLLVAGGLLTPETTPDYGLHWNRLAQLGQGLPRVLEITHRHDTHAGDGFQMLPDFEHYQVVHKGQPLASDATGEIVAQKGGRIMMPAYRPGTDQGFFIARDVPPLFVWILLMLRRMRLDRICHLLPGARRHPDNPNLLDIAGWVPAFWVNIVRLLGWRRTYRDADHTTLRRRRIRR